nr:uncharacterized protein LOC111419251 [Onthophagus taurus]
MQNPADFSKYNPNTLYQTQHFLRKYQDALKWNENENVLEVGCASGTITTQVLYPYLKEKKINNLLAVDISAAAIEVAKATNNNSKILFDEMNFGDLNQGDLYKERFDKIFAFYCFHLVKPAEVWPKNAYKMLKTGGQVFGIVVNSPNFFTDVMNDQIADKSAPWNSHIQNRPNPLNFVGSNPVHEITNILSEAGFTVDLIAREDATSSFKEKENIIKTVSSSSLLSQYVPPEMKEDYSADFLRRIFDRLKIDENGYHYTVEVVCFIATKK